MLRKFLAKACKEALFGPIMDVIFEVKDKIGRTIHLSKERYKHILKHPHMHNQIENIKSAILSPLTMRYFPENKKVIYFYKEFKEIFSKERYLLVAVKYLNGEGFIISSFFTNRIEGALWKTK